MLEETAIQPVPAEPPYPLWKIFFKFLRFGFFAWGGPAVQIAMLREELVWKHHWVKKKKFNRTLAVYQALPGPEATKMAIYLGLHKGGHWGGLLAGLGFILPGFIIVVLLSWFYTLYGASWFLLIFAGIQPAIASLIFKAMHQIAFHMLKHLISYAAVVYAVACLIGGVHFSLVLLACGFFVSFWLKGQKWVAVFILALAPVLFFGYQMLHLALKVETTDTHLLSLLITSVKTGAMSFGGAYTTVPLFREYTVNSHGWLSNTQFLDGLAIISLAPTPVTMLSAYLGFMAAGLPGAAVMAVGAFFPAFCIALFGNGFVQRIVKNKKMRQFLEGVIGGVIGLFAVTAGKLALASITSWKTGMIAGLALVALYILPSRFAVPLCMILAGFAGVLFLR